MVQAAQLRAVITADTSGFQQGMDLVNRQLTGLSDTFKRGLAFGLGFDAITRSLDLLGKGIGDLEKNAIDFNAAIQSTSVAFTTLAKNGDAANNILNQLIQITRGTPFKFEDLAQGAQRMLALGVASQNVVPLLEDVTKSVAAIGGSSANLQRVTYALSQMVSTGTVNAREMRELAMDGVPAWQILADSMGVTQEQARKMVQQNQVTAASFIEAYDQYVHHNLGDVVTAQAQTFNGAMGIISNNIRLLISQGMEPLFAEISKLAVGFANFAKSDQFNVAIGAMQETMRTLITTIGDVVHAFDPLGNAIKAAFIALEGGKPEEALANIIGGIKTQLESFASGMFGAGENLITTYANGMVSAANSLLTGVVNDIANIIAGFFIGHSPPPTGPLTKIQEGGATLMATYAQGMLEGLGGIQNVSQSVMDALNGVDQSMTLEQGRAAVEAAKGNLGELKQVAIEVKSEIDSLDHTMASLDVAMAAVQLQLNSIKQGYSDQINPLRDQIRTIDAQYQPDVNRRGQEIGLEEQINNLKAQQLQKQISGAGAGGPNYDALLQNLKAQSAAIDVSVDTRGVDDAITAMNRKIAQLSEGATTAIDQQLTTVNDELNQISTDGTNVLDDKIRQLQDAKNNLLSNDQEKEVNNLLKERQNASAGEKAIIDAQLGPLRDKYKQQKQIDDQTLIGADSQIVALTKQRDEQKLNDDEHKNALEAQKRSLEDQKASITARLALEKEGLQNQLYGLQDQKTRIERTDADHKKALEAQIAALENQKTNTKDLLTQQIQQLDNQKQLLEIQDQQRSLEKERLELPIKAKIDELKAAEDKATEPLQKQYDTLSAQKQMLSLLQQQWQLLAKDISVATGADKLKKPDGSPPTPLNLPDPKTDTSIGDRWREAGRQAADKFIKGVEDWFHQHLGADIGATIGGILGGTFFGPIGAILGALLGAAIGNKVQDVLTANGITWQSAIENLRSNLGPVWDDIGKMGKGAADNLLDAGNFLGDVVNKRWDQAGNDFVQAWKDSWGLIGNTTKLSIDEVARLIEAAVPEWMNHWNDYRDKNGTLHDGLWSHIKEGWRQLASDHDTWLSTHLPSWLTHWTDFTDQTGQRHIGLTTAIKRTWDDFATGHDSWIGTHLPSWLTSWTDWTDQVGQKHTGLLTVVQNAMTGISTAIGDLVKWLNGTVATMAKAVDDLFGSPFQGAWSTIQNFFDNVGKALSWLGTNLHFKNQITDAPTFKIVGHADGIQNSPHGHIAWVGEKGPELMYVPQGASIFTHEQSKAMVGSGVPGHAGGFNNDLTATIANVWGDITSAVTHGAEWMRDQVLAKFDIGSPDTDTFPELGSSLLGMTKDGILDLIRSHLPHPNAAGRAGGPSGWHHYNDISFDDYMKVVGGYAGSPIADQDDFNMLLSVAKERGMDPRIFMARMQIESGYGTTAGLLAPYFNYIGMGVSDRKWDFDSGVHATDGGPEYAGYQSFHDMLEDLADWLDQYGASFAGYAGGDPSGNTAQGVYAALVSALPAIGGTSVGGVVGGDSNNAVVADALGYLGSQAFLDANGMTYCEGFVDTIRQDMGIGRKGFPSAIAHAMAIEDMLNSGPAPAGTEAFWQGPGWSAYGHTGISAGDGTFISAVSAGITRSAPGWDSNPGYLGWADIAYANGGWINEPVAGLGLNSGMHYLLGENGREYVSPEREMRGGGVTINVDVHFDGSGELPSETALRSAGTTIGQAITQALAASGVGNLSY